MDFNYKTTCRCCGSSDLVPYLDLGEQPLANNYHKGEARQNKYPLCVNLCLGCYNSQLSVVVNPEIMFKNYLYVSGTTRTFKNHCDNIAAQAIKFCRNEYTNYLNGHGLKILDIGANDGTLLDSFRELGCSVMGVDPAENIRDLTIKKNMDVVVGFWGRNLALSRVRAEFDIITATNVFAHVDGSDDFLSGVAQSLKDGGVFIVEFPYGLETIRHREFDQVYHEHLSYFLANSFCKLLERHNFYAANAVLTPIHGGSIRFFVRRGLKPHCQVVKDLIQNEYNHGLLNKNTYINFGAAVNENKTKLINLVHMLDRDGANIVCYGASAKFNTVLNFLGSSFSRTIKYIVDDNEMKHDYLTPGQNIKILPVDALARQPNNLYVVLGAWNFEKEIIQRIKSIRPNLKTKIITYIPNVQVKEV